MLNRAPVVVDAVLALLVGLVVHLTGGPDWAVVGFTLAVASTAR